MILSISTLFSGSSENDLFTMLFIGMAIVLAMVWRNFIIVCIHKVRELFLSSDWRSFEAENANSGFRLRLALGTVHCLSLSIFLYQISKYVAVTKVDYVYFLVAILGIHLFKIVCSKLLSFVFTLKRSYVIWIESYSWIHYVSGVVFFPLAIILTYSPFVTMDFCTYLGLAMLILAETLLIYRLFVVFCDGIVSLFYMFLYLCTLEIIPLLAAYKLLS